MSSLKKKEVFFILIKQIDIIIFLKYKGFIFHGFKFLKWLLDIEFLDI